MSSNPKTIKIPGPDHPITIGRNRDRVVVKVAGRVVADTSDALTLREASYAPVHYVPRKDVDMSLLERTDHETYCPYEGDCAYFSIPAGGAVHQRGVDLRSAIRSGGLDQGPSSLLPRPGRRDQLAMSEIRRFDRRRA
jgi:uncharacterized protein (DUF427 family)